MTDRYRTGLGALGILILQDELTWTEVGEVDELECADDDDDDEDDEEVVDDELVEEDDDDVEDFDDGLLFNVDSDSSSSGLVLQSIESDNKVSFVMSVWLAPGFAFGL